MLKKLLFTTLFIALKLNAQVFVSSDSISFQQLLTGNTDSTSFYVSNNYNQTVEVKITHLKDVYFFSDTLLLIPANDSSIVWIKYKPTQNVIDEDLISISNDDSTEGTIIKVTGSGKYDDMYDASTFNLYDIQLKNVLTSLISNHTSLGYNLARDKMFMEIDNQRVNGQGATQNTLECVYTGRLAVGYTSRTAAQNQPYNFNTEHTWPQSNFGENEPMKSDLYHLYPTDNPANGVRANYPFGNVVSSITWQVGGSRLGKNSVGQTVFEPRDVHKGNLSRSMFYFITRYPVNYGSFFTQIQEDVFREWNILDPVDIVESNRNNAIALLQLNRNPYIDHPEFVDRIYSFAADNVRPVYARLEVLPLKAVFDSVLINNTAVKDFYIANSGSAQLVVDSISISDSRFSITANAFSINPYFYSKLSLGFNPDSIKNYHAVIQVFSNAGIKQVEVTGIGKDNSVNIKDENSIPSDFVLEQNYPNPFNPSTRIIWQSPVGSWQTLKIYDVLGKEVATLVDEYREAGKYEIEFSAGQNFSLSSGVYIYKLSVSTPTGQQLNYIASKKMLLMK